MKVIFLLILSILSLTSCVGKHYQCLNKEKNRGVTFSWSAEGVQVDHIDFPFKFGMWPSNYSEHLDANSQGGHYNVQVEEDFVTVKYIQDVVVTQLKNPKGELLEEGKEAFDKLYKGEYQTLVRLHAVYPTLLNYVLDTKNHQLTQTIAYMERPRKGSIIYFDTKKRSSDGRVYPVKKDSMTDKELKKYFSSYANKKPNEYYYLCEPMGFLKGTLIHWLKIIFFVHLSEDAPKNPTV